MTPTPETIAVIAIGVTLAAVVLQQIRSLGARLETRIDRLEARIARLETGQEALVERVARLEAGQEALVERVARIEAGQEALRRDVKELARDLAALSERTARIEGAVIGPLAARGSRNRQELSPPAMPRGSAPFPGKYP